MSTHVYTLTSTHMSKHTTVDMCTHISTQISTHRLVRHFYEQHAPSRVDEVDDIADRCHMGMCVDLCMDVCMDICMDRCMDICTGMRIDMCICICMVKCGDMCIDARLGVYGPQTCDIKKVFFLLVAVGTRRGAPPCGRWHGA